MLYHNLDEFYYEKVHQKIFSVYYDIGNHQKLRPLTKQEQKVLYYL